MREYIAGAVAEPGGQERSPFDSQAHLVIPVSSISCITARTISRSPSGLLEKSRR